MIDERPALILTRDGDVLRFLAKAVHPAPVEIFFDVHGAVQRLRSAPLSLIVLDDEVLTESERGWLIDECRRRQPGSPIVYVASPRSGTERMAQSHGVSLFATKPVDVGYLRASIRRLRSSHRARPQPTAPVPALGASEGPAGSTYPLADRSLRR